MSGVSDGKSLSNTNVLVYLSFTCRQAHHSRTNQRCEPSELDRAGAVLVVDHPAEACGVCSDTLQSRSFFQQGDLGGRLTAPLERVAPGDRGLDGSCCGIEPKSNGGSTAPFHGRFVRCGATNTLVTRSPSVASNADQAPTIGIEQGTEPSVERACTARLAWRVGSRGTECAKCASRAIVKHRH